jgi:hypothetical protein
MGKIHINGEVWTWRGGGHHFTIRDPKGKKHVVDHAKLLNMEWSAIERGMWKGNPYVNVTPADIRRYIEGHLLYTPDGIKCLTCYGKGKRPGRGGRMVPCRVCGGAGRHEPCVSKAW